MHPLRIILLVLFLSVNGLYAQQNYRDTIVAGKHGVADNTGKLVIAADYDEIEFVQYDALNWETNERISSGETLFKTRLGSNWGLFSERGSRILENQYEDIVVDYSDNGAYRIIMAKQKGGYALFDPDGRILTAFIYTHVDTGNFPDGIVAYVRKKGSKKTLLINKQGLIISQEK